MSNRVYTKFCIESVPASLLRPPSKTTAAIHHRRCRHYYYYYRILFIITQVGRRCALDYFSFDFQNLGFFIIQCPAYTVYSIHTI